MKSYYLFLSLPRHDAAFTSTPWQLAKELAVHTPVFFIDHPYTFWEGIRKLNEPTVQNRWKAYFNKKYKMQDGIVVVASPFVWPINFLPPGKVYRFFKRWNERMLANRINAVAEYFKVQHWLYVNSFNFYFHHLYQHLLHPVHLKVYHCIDPIIKPYSKKHGHYLEPEAAQQSDLVIATAPSLSKRFKKEGLNQQSYLIPNAAQVKLFSSNNLSLHPTVQNISGKVMGYLGSIERRMDYTLLLDVLNQLPDWTLLLAGPVEEQYIPDSILEHPRVRFTGPIQHEETPSVINRFDVAIIPFLKDEASAGIYPLKMFEYLAAGKPVVSTNFNPEILIELVDVVTTCHNATDFANACKQIIETESVQQVEKRKRVAEKNTWTHRAQQWHELIVNFLNAKKHVGTSIFKK